MGIFDFLRRPGARRDQVAIDIDLATGVLETCPVCHAVFDRQRDDRLPTAELMAHQYFDHQNPCIAVFAGDCDDLLHRLRSVRGRFNFHCTCQEAG